MIKALEKQIRQQKESEMLNALGTLSQCLSYQQTGDNRKRWFVSYGALLWFIRDKNMGVSFDQDLDISIFEDSDFEEVERFLKEFGFTKKTEFLNDRTKKPLKMVFRAARDIDIFMQIKANGYYWHTYDHHGEFKSIPKKGYIFKGIPCELMDGNVWKYHWDERIPELNFPKKYGSLLDTWYPGWFIPDKRFGQSRAVKMVKLKTCKNLKENLK